MADVTFTIPMHQDYAGDANALVDITVDGATVVTGQAVVSQDADNPTNVTFTVTGLTEGSHTMEIIMTNEYYVDADNDRNVIINGAGIRYIPAYDTFKTGVQKTAQDAMATVDDSVLNFPDRYRALADAMTAVSCDGVEYTADQYGTDFIVWVDRASITFNYANNGYNEYPYRNIVDAGTTPPTLSTKVNIPWNTDFNRVSNPKTIAGAPDTSYALYADE